MVVSEGVNEVISNRILDRILDRMMCYTSTIPIEGSFERIFYGIIDKIIVNPR